MVSSWVHTHDSVKREELSLIRFLKIHNTRFNTGGFNYPTTGFGVMEFYTDIKLYPENFSINLILLQ